MNLLEQKELIDNLKFPKFYVTTRIFLEKVIKMTFLLDLFCNYVVT
ncbi:MAG: hypothetical protein LBM96_03675 [Methanobrevibacter sp.]|jgi:hypothetical protein|nr:hypothetical protein [Candidatus Methanoflexus mossambicus]